MRTKSKYREFKDGGRVDLPGQDELPIEQPAPEAPIAATATAVDNLESKPPEMPELQPAAAKPDDATLALQKQLDDLRKSEELQKQQAEINKQNAAQAAQQQLSPEQLREVKLSAWRQSGQMSAEEESFLKAHPKLIDFSDVTNHAANLVLASGVQRGSKEYLDGVLHHFDAFVEQAAQQAANPAMQPTPKFFKAPAPPRQPPAPTMASFVSAPVSRGVPASDGKRDRGKVTLTRQEQEAAKISGVTLEEYAKNKAKYQEMRANGEYGSEGQR